MNNNFSKITLGTLSVLFLTLTVREAQADMIVSQDLEISSYTASSTWKSDNTPDLAFDGDLISDWNSASYATAWIEVDLGQIFSLSSVNLLVEQLPNVANTVHQVWTSNNVIANDTSGATLSYTFSGTTTHNQWISANFLTTISAKHVQIRTIDSPSWVAWNEIQVLASPVPEPTTMLLFGTGLIGLASSRFRKRK